MKLEVNDVCLQKGIILKNEYQIKKAISCGELSIVYVGYNIRSGCKQIIKEFYPRKLALRDLDERRVLCRFSSSKSDYSEMMEAFFSEARILKELQHRNIAKYVDDFEENGTGYIVTEYVRGKTLDVYIKERNEGSRPGFFKETIFPLLDAVEYIHEQGIIHRDIKPGNIIIDKRGQPTVIDFGSAIYYKKENRKKIFITPGFSPLEFYSEKSRQGRYSDIYSLAATLYYCFYGKAPSDVGKRLIEDRIENPGWDNRKVTSLLSSVIMKNLSIDYKARFTSVKFLKIFLYLEYFACRIKGN